MNYESDILNKLVDMYERRNTYDKDENTIRAIQIDVTKKYPEYVDRFNYDAFQSINYTIEKLISESVVEAKIDKAGKYKNIKLNVGKIQAVYKKLGRKGIPEQCDDVMVVLEGFDRVDNVILISILDDFKKNIKARKKLPYELGFDCNRIKSVLEVIGSILRLETETYIRNFSTALFKDSKIFQREYKSVVESILYDFTESVVEKDKILEYYNLYDNPTYVYVKGDMCIEFNHSFVDLKDMPDGIALSNASLDNIKSIKVNAEKVITVENLTTYYDCKEPGNIYIYLGGFHNSTKQKFLLKTYSDNKNCAYYHMGDIDVYGFLILENLISKTEIPFNALKMDKHTLDRFYRLGLYKALTENDKKVINAKKDSVLSKYKDVLDYMLVNNCKVEQESIKAVELMENN